MLPTQKLLNITSVFHAVATFKHFRIFQKIPNIGKVRVKHNL